MSDFLTNLVMRSFSGTPSVQPMTYSAYAAPEAPLDPAIETPAEETFTAKQAAPRRHVESIPAIDQPESLDSPSAQVDTSVDPVVPPIQNQIQNQIQTHEPEPVAFELEKSVVPVIVDPSRTISVPGRVTKQPKPSRPVNLENPAVPDHTISKPETKTEIQPAQLVYRTGVQTTRPVTRRVSKELPTVVSATEQTRETSREPGPEPEPASTSESKPESKSKHELEIVEHVIERSSVTPPVTIEKTQQVTSSSFTTLIPNTPPQPLPALKSRARTPQPALPDEVEQPVPQPETVINVAIGRIEVRATPASNQKRERQQHGPKVMTLDDYLQQRSRGTQ